jgi:hypothetical protein
MINLIKAGLIVQQAVPTAIDSLLQPGISSVSGQYKTMILPAVLISSCSMATQWNKTWQINLSIEGSIPDSGTGRERMAKNPGLTGSLCIKMSIFTKVLAFNFLRK